MSHLRRHLCPLFVLLAFALTANAQLLSPATESELRLTTGTPPLGALLARPFESPPGEPLTDQAAGLMHKP